MIRTLFYFAATVAFATLASPAFGQITFTWDDGGADGLWSTALNWDLDSGAPGTTDTAIFNSTSAFTTIDLGGAQTINHLNFNDAGTSSFTIGVLGVDTLTFDNGGGIDHEDSNRRRGRWLRHQLLLE